MRHLSLLSTFLWLVFPAVSVSLPSDTSKSQWLVFTEPEHDLTIRKTLDLLQRQEYDSAAALLAREVPDSHPASAYFGGLCAFARFNDLGDTSGLNGSQRLWETLYPGGTPKRSQEGDTKIILYRGLSALQLAYVARVKGHKIQSARLGLAAADILGTLPQYLEARLALALFDYYKAPLLNNFAWLPFVKNRDQDLLLGFLERHYPQSPYLESILRNSLIWLYFDAKNYPRGLTHIDSMLHRYPKNRSLLQMRADFLYRQGDFEGARDIYEKSKREYAEISSLEKTNGYVPIGYLSAVGNLARIYRNLDDKPRASRHLELWKSEAAQPFRPFLPESLKKDLQRLE